METEIIVMKSKKNGIKISIHLSIIKKKTSFIGMKEVLIIE